MKNMQMKEQKQHHQKEEIYYYKGGFTLVELILVIVIIGVILVFALPNVTGTIEKNKKTQMIEDGKSAIEIAKNHVLNNNLSLPAADCGSEMFLKDIDKAQSIITSPFGGVYNTTESYVKVCKESNSYVYKVYLVDDANHKLCSTTFPCSLDELISDNKYNYVKIIP